MISKKDFSHRLMLLLVVVGAMGTPVRLAHLTRAANFLRILGISPAPSPYTAMSNDGKFPLGGVFYRCMGSHGDSKTAKNDYELRNRIAGPHGRTIVYLVSNSEAARKDINPMILSTLRFGWCHNGPLALAAGCPHDVQSVDVQVRDRVGYPVLFEEKIPCQP